MRIHAITGKRLPKMIYRGLYYPVFGRENGWVNGRTKQLFEVRIGGWDNYDKWWSFTFGIKVRLFNSKLPYRDFVIKAIKDHYEMKIVKECFDDCGKYVECENNSLDIDKIYSMYTVRTTKNEHIGDIGSAYNLLHFKHFKSYDKDDSIQICRAWNPITNKVCAWSHRAMMCFGKGDKLFESEFGNEKTPFNQHGKITIKTQEHKWQSALNFANYVS